MTKSIVRGGAGEPLKDGAYRITDMIEKPSLEEAPSNLGIGRYILTSDIFDILRVTPPEKTVNFKSLMRSKDKHKMAVFWLFGLRQAF